jgi:hypothetical protein
MQQRKEIEQFGENLNLHFGKLYYKKKNFDNFEVLDFGWKFLKLTLEGLNKKHVVQREICVRTQHLLQE